MDSTTQIYLEIKRENGLSVVGEASAGGYENRIDIDSFEFSASAKKTTLKEVRQVRRGVFANLAMDRVTLSKVFDRSSLLLAGVLSRHEKFSEAKIAIDQQYIDPEAVKFRNEILIVYLKSGYIADIHMRTTEGDKGASIQETLTLAFHGCTVLYYAEDRGRAGNLGDDYRWETCTFEKRPDEQGS